MLKRTLPASSIKLDGATFSLSKSISSNIAQAAIDRAKAVEQAIPKTEDPSDIVAAVEELHKDWDRLKALVDQLKSEAEQFSTAADALEGEVVIGSTPLVELSVQTRSAFETLRLMDPNYEIERVGETANLLREAADKLLDNLTTTKSRAIKHDITIRRCALRALASEHVNYLRDIKNNFELPSDFELPPDVPLPERNKAFCDAAKQYFRDEALYADAQKRARKTEARKAKRKEIAELWK